MAGRAFYTAMKRFEGGITLGGALPCLCRAPGAAPAGCDDACDHAEIGNEHCDGEHADDGLGLML
jgi:hypothetical protein